MIVVDSTGEFWRCTEFAVASIQNGRAAAGVLWAIDWKTIERPANERRFVARGQKAGFEMVVVVTAHGRMACIQIKAGDFTGERGITRCVLVEKHHAIAGHTDGIHGGVARARCAGGLGRYAQHIILRRDTVGVDGKASARVVHIARIGGLEIRTAVIGNIGCAYGDGGAVAADRDAAGGSQRSHTRRQLIRIERDANAAAGATGSCDDAGRRRS